MRNNFPDIVEKSRKQNPLYPPTVEGEKNGYFEISHKGNIYIVIISDGEGWDHVSVSILRKKRCPTWEEMCWLKDLFFDETELVVQYHPPKSDHVNMHPYCLHLWRFQGDMPKPDKIMVGY